MMKIHHVENSDRNKNTFTFLNILLYSKVCCSSVHEIRVRRKKARKLQATLVRKYDPATDSLTEVRCRATSLAKKNCPKIPTWVKKRPPELLGGRPSFL